MKVEMRPVSKLQRGDWIGTTGTMGVAEFGLVVQVEKVDGYYDVSIAGDYGQKEVLIDDTAMILVARC